MTEDKIWINGDEVTMTDIPALEDNEETKDLPTPPLLTTRPGMCKCTTVRRPHTKYMHQLYAD